MDGMVLERRRADPGPARVQGGRAADPVHLRRRDRASRHAPTCGTRRMRRDLRVPLAGRARRRRRCAPGELAVPVIAAGASARVPLPPVPVRTRRGDLADRRRANWRPTTAWASRRAHRRRPRAARPFERASRRRPLPTCHSGRALQQHRHPAHYARPRRVRRRRPVRLGRPRRVRAAAGAVPRTDRQRRGRRPATRPEPTASVTGVSNARLWRREGLDRLTTATGVSSGDRDAPAHGRAGSARRTPPASVSVESIWTLNGRRARVAGRDRAVGAAGARCGRGSGSVSICRTTRPPSTERAGSGSARWSPTPTASAPRSRPFRADHRRPVGGLRAPAGDRAPLGAAACSRSQCRQPTCSHLMSLPDTRGRRPGFTLSRHTPQQIAAAGHPFELPASRHEPTCSSTRPSTGSARAPVAPTSGPSSRYAPKRARSGSASQQVSPRSTVFAASAAPPGSRPSHTPPAPRSRGSAAVTGGRSRRPRGSPQAGCGLACGQDVMTICQDKVLP